MHELVLTQVEAASGVCTTLEALAKQLAGRRKELASAAERHGDLLVGVGHPVLQGSTPRFSHGERYDRIRRLYAGMVTDYQASGCHVHVGVPDRDAGVMVLNRLRPWLPTLVAMFANSPFDHGADTGFQSWRTVIQSRWPGSGVPPVFEGAADYDESIFALVRAGVVVDRSMTFWLARCSERYATVEVRVADATTSVAASVLLEK